MSQGIVAIETVIAVKAKALLCKELVAVLPKGRGFKVGDTSVYPSQQTRRRRSAARQQQQRGSEQEPTSGASTSRQRRTARRAAERGEANAAAHRAQ